MADNNMSEEIRRLEEEFRRLTETTSAQQILQQARNDAEAKSSKATQAFGAAIKTSVSTLSSFGSALLSTERGLTKYNGAIDAATKGLGEVTKNMGFVGTAINMVGKAVSFAVKTMLKFDQDALQAGDQLAEIGAIGGFTTTELRRLADGANYYRENIQKFAELMTTAGTSIISLGTGSAESVKKFAQIISLPEDTIQSFRSMGISNERVNKAQAQYVKMAVAAGYSLTGSIQSIQQQSIAYTKNLYQLAALTGKNVDQLAREQEAAAADLQFQMEAAAIREKISNASTEAEKKKYQQELNALTTISSLGQQFGFVGEELSGFLQYGLTGVVTNLNEKVFRLLPDLPRLFEDVRSGSATAGQLLEYMTKATGDQVKAFNMLIRIAPEMAADLGITSKRIEAMGINSGKTAEELDEAARNIKRDLQDPQKEMRNFFEELERKLNKMVSEFVQLMSGPIRTGLIMFLKAINSLGKAIAWLSDKTMGTNLSPLFMSAEEAEQERVKILSKQDEYLNQILQKRQRIDELANGRMTGPAQREAARLKTEIDLLEKEIELEKTREEQLKTTIQFQQQLKDLKIPSAFGPTTNAQQLLDFIASKESGGRYGILQGQKAESNLTGMTIKELLAFQQSEKAAGRTLTGAAGKYQIIPSTLQSLLKEGVAKEEEYFSPEVQERLGLALLKRRGLEEFRGGKISKEEFMDRLSKEWAALPFSTGKSFYEGKAGNKALTTREELASVLPQAQRGGAFFGSKDGYPVMLHGNELVIPMSDFPTANKVELSNLTGLSNEIATAVSSTPNQGFGDIANILSDKLDKVIDKLSSTNDIQEQILRYSRF